MFQTGRMLLITLLLVFVCHNISGKEAGDKREKNKQGDEVYELAPVVVLGKSISYENREIGDKALLTHKVVDLAEILSDEMVEVQMIRKSGYGNEVSIRGFGQENINVLIDEGILEGACGSRKDPALSHINMLTVKELVVKQGPFDVTKPGYLGGYINVITKKPDSGFSGEIVSRAGSYSFLSNGFMVTGGNEYVKGLLGYNYSKSGQYEDGAGNVISQVRDGVAASYNNAGINADSFKKHDLWGKINITPSEKLSLLIEHTHGEARDILTPRVVFDTEKEINRFSKISLSIDNASGFSDKLTLFIYRNAIEHYPFQGFRNVPVPKNNIVESVITGGGISNMVETGYADIMYGVDIYHRRWWGDVYNSLTGALLNGYLIPNVKSFNMGAFFKADKRVDKWAFSIGLRYDRFSQKADEELVFTQGITSSNKQRDSLPGGYLMAKYYLRDGITLFSGIGGSHRPPTSAERYIQGSATFFGNPDLKPVSNSEYDMGITIENKRWEISAKAFYSDLDDFIYQELNSAVYQSYTNIDARILGGDIKFRVDILDSFTLNGGMALQRGYKDSFPDNNREKALGQIAPLKTRLSLDFHRARPFDIEDTELYSTIEWVHSEDADHIDQDAGEVPITGWDIMNIRIGYRYKSVVFNFGIENVFDRLYTVANSYEWDVVGGTGVNPAIVNEPGRFIYGSVAFNW
ncbi:MAG: TonB-dependent receptor [Desulfatiglans sp.]|nr:TonB-dependent receptor [Desulfatiglans sp.]